MGNLVVRDDGRLYILAVDAKGFNIRIFRCTFRDDLERLLGIGKIDLDAVEKGSECQVSRLETLVVR